MENKKVNSLPTDIFIYAIMLGLKKSQHNISGGTQ